MSSNSYNHKNIEERWSTVWEKNKTFRVDLLVAEKPFYNLAMFPYPSAEGLHMGHIIPYSGVDTYGRYLRMNGFSVFEPMGFDAFGIHSENFAIKKGIHPKTLIAKTTTYFREKQMKRLGTLFDWEKEVNTTDPDYYKWTQWLFVQMFKHGLAQKKKAPVTYCPSCKTVLSDEQTETKNSITVCERCKSPIERKELEQWFFKITKYADKLLNNLNNLSPDAFGENQKVSEKDQKNGINWSEKTKNAQREWIGKQEGVEISFPIANRLSRLSAGKAGPEVAIRENLEKITVFTKFPETVFGVTYLVVAPEYPLIKEILSSQTKIFGFKYDEVKKYAAYAKTKTEQERVSEDKEKTGVFTGIYVINPVNGKKVPVWTSDYVLANYGTGAVMGVPAHDFRDFAFAKKYKLPIIRVVGAEKDDCSEVKGEKDIIEKGFLVNSKQFDGLKTPGEGKEKLVDWMVKNKFSLRKTIFRLRDWCISRQRYWGPPIPMIFCKKCSWQTVPEQDLPVLLPFVKDYKPTGDGKSPLAKDAKWMKVKCPKCGQDAQRETDVSDTFLDSAWYFLRYPSVGLTGDASKNNKLKIKNCKLEIPWDSKITRRWLPVDMYIGGHEHAVLHLMYSRFVTMALKDMGFIDFEEPFKRFFAHGLMLSEGAKMSKSRGNVVNPNEYLDKYGADTLRLYVMFMGPYDAGGDFRTSGIAGMNRFLGRVWTLISSTKDVGVTTEELTKRLKTVQHKTIKKVTEDVSSLRFNTAIASIMEYYNSLVDIAGRSERKKLFNCVDWKEAVKTLLLLLSPFAPFLAEELWQKIKNGKTKSAKNLNSIHDEKWPQFDPLFLESDEVTLIIEVNGKIRDRMQFKTEIAMVKTEVEKAVFENEKIKAFLFGKTPKNVIFVPGKLINVVV